MRISIGVISIVLSVLVYSQSKSVEYINVMEQNGEYGGFGGIILSILMLISGIIILSAKKNRGAQTTSSILLAVGGVFGLQTADSYGDLYIWSVIAITFSILDYYYVAKKIPKNSD